MYRTGGEAVGLQRNEVKEDDDEWMKCADCETFSRRPLVGGEWEPRPELTLPPSERRTP